MQSKGRIDPDVQDELDVIKSRLDAEETKSADHESRISNLENQASPPAPPSTIHKVLDLSSGVLPDEVWALSQPEGSILNIVKDNSANTSGGPRPLTVVAGVGPEGQNVLRQTVNGQGQLDGIWVLRRLVSNGQLFRLNSSNDMYFANGQGPFNRLSYKVRYPSGFRNNYCSRTDYDPSENGYPYHQFCHVGTYHYDPAKWGQFQQETDNYHFYHWPFVRADQANGDWVQVTLNEHPHFQRSVNQTHMPNPTKGHGDYWNILTAFYIENVQYTDSPEINSPYFVDYCDFELWYEPPILSSSWDTIGNNDEIDVPVASNPSSWTATIKNLTSQPVDVRMGKAAYWVTNCDLDLNSTTIPANGSVQVRLTCNAVKPWAGRYPVGFWCTPVADYGLSNPFPTSQNEDNVERRWDNVVGPHTARSTGCRFKLGGI